MKHQISEAHTFHRLPVPTNLYHLVTQQHKVENVKVP